MRQDATVCDRWVLGDVHHVDNWYFSDPPVNFMEPGTYTLDVRFDGKEVDYSLAGYASVPVLSERAKIRSPVCQRQTNFISMSFLSR